MPKRLPLLTILIVLALPVCLSAQDSDTPLGDIARAFRRNKDEKKAPGHAVIDNENLDQLVADLQSHRFTTSLLFSFDNVAKDFKVSSPDVTCSLSFSAKTSTLLTDPYTPRELPGDELAKLDGPATIQGGSLEVSVFNGSAWDIKEITVGFTVVRAPSLPYGPQLLKPAAERTVETLEKRSDRTVILHLKGTASPQSTTVFTEDLPQELSPEQEWHWAIVSAKGIPPKVTPEALGATPASPVVAPPADKPGSPADNPDPSSPAVQPELR